LPGMRGSRQPHFRGGVSPFLPLKGESASPLRRLQICKRHSGAERALSARLGLSVGRSCDVHGFLVATTPNATVWCSCGKRTRHQRHGRLADPDTLKPTQAKARKLNSSGQPVIHACGDCGADFRGRTLQKRHRVGRASSKRCLTAEEMIEKGWALDEDGRWRDRSDTERLSRLKGASALQLQTPQCG
jgi:hypothetical protein